MNRKTNLPFRRTRHLIIMCCLILMMSLLVACGGKLSGSYQSEGFLSQTFTFDGDNITMSAFGISTTGTYKIEDDKLKIEYSMFGQNHKISYDFEKQGKSLIIQGTKFNKVKK